MFRGRGSTGVYSYIAGMFRERPGRAGVAVVLAWRIVRGREQEAVYGTGLLGTKASLVMDWQRRAALVVI